MSINKGTGRREPIVDQVYGALPITANPGLNPLSRIMPTQPIMAKAKAIGIPWDMRRKKAARPMRQITSGDTRYYPFLIS
jgi:hypothetical protein